jgi:hypothetical protein
MVRCLPAMRRTRLGRCFGGASCIDHRLIGFRHDQYEKLIFLCHHPLFQLSELALDFEDVEEACQRAQRFYGNLR